MSNARLPAGLEAAAIRRSVEALGGHAMVLHKGDPDRGQLILLVGERGAHRAILERALQRGGNYHWTRRESAQTPDPATLAKFIGERTRFDPDLWLIELDVPDAERFIAEMTAFG